MIFKLVKLKEYNFYEVSKKPADRQDYHIDKSFSYRERPKLQKLYISLNVSSEWYPLILIVVVETKNYFRSSINEQGNAEQEEEVKLMSTFCNLTYVSLRNIRSVFFLTFKKTIFFLSLP